MAERSADRAPSISSSVTEAEIFDDNEKASSLSSTEGEFTKLKSPEEMEIGDEDMERAGLLPAEEQEKPQTVSPDNSMRTAAIWMVVNTLATIGIVSLRMVSEEVSTNFFSGLYQQGHLLRSIVKAGTTDLRCFPLLHNMAHSVHTFAASIRHVRPKESCDQGNNTTGHRHVFERYPSESFPRVFDSHILPSSANPTYTYGSAYELCSLQIYTTQERHICLDSSLCGCRNGLILRFASQQGCYDSDDKQLGSYICLLRHFCQFPLHSLDLQLPQEASDEQHATVVEPGATCSFYAALCHSLCGYIPRLDRSTNQQMGFDYDGMFHVATVLFRSQYSHLQPRLS
jgi:hypothetical protein